MEFRIPYGKKGIEISLPKHKVYDILAGSEIPTLDRSVVKSRIETAIINSSPNHLSLKKIVILVPDITRLWTKGYLFVPIIVDSLLKQGADRQNVKIIIGTGTHSDTSKDEYPALVGNETLTKVKVENHCSLDIHRLTYLGETSRGTPVYLNKEVTEADYIVIFGGITYHNIAGFSGGRKMILPGISGYETIQKNHSLALMPDGSPHPSVSQAILEKNPVSEDMIEGAQLLLENKSSLLINVAASGKGELSFITAGDWLRAWLAGCEQVGEAGNILIDKKADFAIVSAGGYEKDGQLDQSTKALFNAVRAVKEKGEIVFIAECRDGIGMKEFNHALTNFRGNGSELGKKLTGNFSMLSYVAFRLIDILARFKVTLISNLTHSETEALGFNYTSDLDALIKKQHGKGYVIPSGENILPVEKLENEFLKRR